VWEDLYEEESEVPDVRSARKRKEWLNGNQPFLDLLSLTNVPINYFQYLYYKPKYIRNSKEIYSLRVRAKAGVMCLIQPVLAEEDSLRMQLVAYKPADDDPDYFQFSEIPE